ncbi:unnamed protein product [Prunus armeniaca]|uniref:Uncharacterized protein n=1 Tax=Prunus armeniaca TaxID=36596 RepID=A0A6J5VX53_PRUAR|nr:unnamed protein product [Prunus armeniaca]
MTEHSRFSGSHRAVPSPPSCQARSCVNTWKIILAGPRAELLLGGLGILREKAGLFVGQEQKGARQKWLGSLKLGSLELRQEDFESLPFGKFLLAWLLEGELGLGSQVFLLNKFVYHLPFGSCELASAPHSFGKQRSCAFGKEELGFDPPKFNTCRSARVDWKICGGCFEPSKPSAGFILVRSCFSTCRSASRRVSKFHEPSSKFCSLIAVRQGCWVSLGRRQEVRPRAGSISRASAGSGLNFWAEDFGLSWAVWADSASGCLDQFCEHHPYRFEEFCCFVRVVWEHWGWGLEILYRQGRSFKGGENECDLASIWKPGCVGHGLILFSIGHVVPLNKIPQCLPFGKTFWKEGLGANKCLARAQPSFGKGSSKEIFRLARLPRPPLANDLVGPHRCAQPLPNGKGASVREWFRGGRFGRGFKPISKASVGTSTRAPKIFYGPCRSARLAHGVQTRAEPDSDPGLGQALQTRGWALFSYFWQGWAWAFVKPWSRASTGRQSWHFENFMSPHLESSPFARDLGWAIFADMSCWSSARLAGLPCFVLDFGGNRLSPRVPIEDSASWPKYLADTWAFGKPFGSRAFKASARKSAWHSFRAGMVLKEVSHQILPFEMLRFYMQFGAGLLELGPWM